MITASSSRTLAANRRRTSRDRPACSAMRGAARASTRSAAPAEGAQLLSQLEQSPRQHRALPAASWRSATACRRESRHAERTSVALERPGRGHRASARPAFGEVAGTSAPMAEVPVELVVHGHAGTRSLGWIARGRPFLHFTVEHHLLVSGRRRGRDGGWSRRERSTSVPMPRHAGGDFGRHRPEARARGYRAA
jgi:hypothetical protein